MEEKFVYCSFMLRCWQRGDKGAPVFQLEEITSGQRIAFTSLQELINFIENWISIKEVGNDTLIFHGGGRLNQ